MRYRLRLDRLERILDESRLSQNHWALKLGLSRGHWSDIVNGKHPFPSAKTRERMLEVFSARQQDLFDEVDEAAATSPEFRLAISPRYEVSSEIGQGGMGTVYLAHDRSLGRTVAIKVVSAEAVAGVGADQLLQEISHIARLQHPNILPVHDAEVRAGQPYYVMPYVPQGSLAQLITDRVRLSLRTTLELTNSVAAALAHAHARQVLHCDIKPHNILIHGSHAYLMDFGIARKLHSEALEWTGLRKELDFSAGTPAYVSPEQASGDRAIDARSDIYSLACVVYEMLTGRPPFSGTTTNETVSKRFHESAPDLRVFAPDTPPEVAAVIERAMSIDPAKRPHSAEAFAEQLNAAASSHSRVGAGVSLAISRLAFRARSIAGLQTKHLRFPMFGLDNDIRFVARGMVRHWRFSLGVILSLGLGVGLGIPILSIADHIFLRTPPGITEPDRVAKLVMRQRLEDGRIVASDGLTGLDYAVTTAYTKTLTGAAGWINLTMTEGRGDAARPVNVTLTSASFFPVLGVQPFLGRFYVEQEDVEGMMTAPVVVSYRYWKNVLGGTTSAVGRTLFVGTVSYTVVGVAPEGFNGLGFNAIDLWLPIHVAAPEFQGRDPKLWTTDHSSWLRIVVRMKPGVSAAAATVDANRAYRLGEARTRKPGIADPMHLDELQPGRSSNRAQTTKIAVWLSGGAVLLLLLVTANLVNLFLARNSANARQVAIRLAIGGGRKQLLRLHALESLMLGGCAAMMGLLVSVPTVRVARALMFPGVQWLRPVLDIRIAVVAFGIAALVGLLIALWTTVQSSRIDPATLLRASGTAQMAGTRRSHQVRRALLVSQAAMLALLLSGSAAFVLSLQRATVVEVGFNIDDLMVAKIPLSAASVTPEQVRALYDRALEQVRNLPQVAMVTVSYTEPWMNNREGSPTVPGSNIKAPPFTLFDVATPEYLNTFGATLHAGRWIESTDRAGAPPVIVINESLARNYWPSGSALGHCVRVGADSTPCREVVGVVRDFRMLGGIEGPMTPAYWIPVAQAQQHNWSPKIFFRARGDANAAMVAVRRTLQSLQADLPLVEVYPIKKNIAWLYSPLQLGTAVFTAFGVLAAVIAAVGLYSVLSFLVVEQRRTYAIQLALGASSRLVVRPIVGQALTTVSIGLGAGFFIAFQLGTLFKSMLFQTSITEPAVVALVAALALLVTLAAALVPVQRVLKTDAMAVLRDQ